MLSKKFMSLLQSLNIHIPPTAFVQIVAKLHSYCLSLVLKFAMSYKRRDVINIFYMFEGFVYFLVSIFINVI